MDTFGEGPRKPQKAMFWTVIQEHLYERGETFMYYGYPDIYGGRTTGSDRRPEINYAINLMNAVHSCLDFEQAPTCNAHVEKCAQQAISGAIRNNIDDLRRLDLHCDFGQWVVMQKRGTQNNRDERLRAEIADETEVASTSKGRIFEL